MGRTYWSSSTAGHQPTRKTSVRAFYDNEIEHPRLGFLIPVQTIWMESIINLVCNGLDHVGLLILSCISAIPALMISVTFALFMTLRCALTTKISLEGSCDHVLWQISAPLPSCPPPRFWRQRLGFLDLSGRRMLLTQLVEGSGSFQDDYDLFYRNEVSYNALWSPV